jgi:hypothetical protein
LLLSLLTWYYTDHFASFHLDAGSPGNANTTLTDLEEAEPKDDSDHTRQFQSNSQDGRHGNVKSVVASVIWVGLSAITARLLMLPV